MSVEVVKVELEEAKPAETKPMGCQCYICKPPSCDPFQNLTTPLLTIDSNPRCPACQEWASGPVRIYKTLSVTSETAYTTEPCANLREQKDAFNDPVKMCLPDCEFCRGTGWMEVASKRSCTRVALIMKKST